MRGAPLAVVLVGVDGGIIPAYAGSTMFDRHANLRYKDHPRVCGEHTKVPRAIWTN